MSAIKARGLPTTPDVGLIGAATRDRLPSRRGWVIANLDVYDATSHALAPAIVTGY